MNRPLTPPPPAARLSGPSFHTIWDAIVLSGFSCTLVPPTPVTSGEDAGKLTDSRSTGPERVRHAVEPSSPLEARTEIPLAAAAARAPSTARTPAYPIDSTSAGSH